MLEGDAIEIRWTVTETIYQESLRGIIVILEGTAANSGGLVCSSGRLEMLLQE